MDAVQPHIAIDASVGARCALLPGDPGRIDRIAEHLSEVQELAFNREFRSLSGFYLGTKILAISTGIGGASCGIAVEELKNIGVDTMIRIGSCGALRNGIGLGDLILAAGAVRDDGASRSYIEEKYPAVPDPELFAFCEKAALSRGFRIHRGIVRSHDSFYTDEQEQVQSYWAGRGVLGCDMETAALYVIGRLRGVRTMSILNNVVLAEGDTAAGISSYAEGGDLTAFGETAEILTALDALHLAAEEI